MHNTSKSSPDSNQLDKATEALYRVILTYDENADPNEQHTAVQRALNTVSYEIKNGRFVHTEFLLKNNAKLLRNYISLCQQYSVDSKPLESLLERYLSNRVEPRLPLGLDNEKPLARWSNSYEQLTSLQQSLQGSQNPVSRAHVVTPEPENNNSKVQKPKNLR